ncbi:MAG: hypothetical protein R8K53_07445 [Mariprofundaceae bacterium]
MRVLCPHCQAVYQLPAVDADAVLVCHRCSTEFSIGDDSRDAQPDNTKTQPGASAPNLFTAPTKQPDSNQKNSGLTDPVQMSATPTATEQEEETSQQTSGTATEREPQKHIAKTMTESIPESPLPVEKTAKIITPDLEKDQTTPPAPPPPRVNARMMPWLFSMLLLIGGSGFWINHEAWLDDPWLRSVLLNIGAPVQIRDKDWHITPASVDATWIKRTPNDTILVITGEVTNRLQTDLLPPGIHFTLYARDNPDARILERNLVITRPPLMQAIRKKPFVAPPRDDTPVAALGTRGFVLVLENMPQNAGNFALSPHLP